MSKIEGLEMLYHMFERKGWQEIRLKDLELICITVAEMEREKENAKA